MLAQAQDDATQVAIARGHVISEQLQMATMPAHMQARYVLDTPGGYDWPTIEQVCIVRLGTLLRVMAAIQEYCF